jgi:nucleosome binding factor SPN SPT16 subunit
VLLYVQARKTHAATHIYTHALVLPSSLALTVVLLYGPDEEQPYKRSASVQLFLFGWEFSLTAMVMTDTTLFVLTSPKKASMLNALGLKGE